MSSDYAREQLNEARRIRDGVEQLRKNYVWQLLEQQLQIEMEERRRAYEIPVGRSMDELIKNEASRGALAAVRNVLEFPDRTLAAAQNMIEALKEESQDDNE